MSGGGSAVVRRQLGSKLRRLRLAAGKAVSDVTTAKLGSKAKMSRIESGKGPVRLADVRALCWFYGADPETTEALAALVPGTREDDWWEPAPGVVPHWFGLFAGLEASADRIRCFEPQLVSGLLQTEAYARAVLGADARLAPEVVEQRVRFRMERQARSWDNVTVILGETALRLQVGSDEVMSGQLDHLRSAAADVRVLPFSAGAVVLPYNGAWVMLAFDAAEDPSVVYVEGVGVARYLDKPADWADYDKAWSNAAARAVPIREWSL